MIVYRELSSLCADLGLSPKQLYSLSNAVQKHYHSVSIPKRSGDFRKLMIPDESLLMVQRRIYHRLLSEMRISNAATAYIPGRNIKRNAAFHVHKKVVLKLDILHFFDNILYRDVKEKVFPADIYSEPLRVLLTTLCYGINELPQGAATSPAISNIILYAFDEEVLSFCRERNITYTRYADDMTFSGDFEPEEVIAFVSGRLRKEGFLLNNRKTVILKQGQRMSVTGITVNEKLNTLLKYRKRIRQELYYIKKYGLEDHLLHQNRTCQGAVTVSEQIKYLQKLFGKVNYCLMIRQDDTEMQAYKTIISDMIRNLQN